jgi:hypothetical protein
VESYTFNRTVPADVYSVKGKISALRAPTRTAKISSLYGARAFDESNATPRKQHVPTLDLFFFASLNREIKAVRPDLKKRARGEFDKVYWCEVLDRVGAYPNSPARTIYGDRYPFSLSPRTTPDIGTD